MSVIEQSYEFVGCVYVLQEKIRLKFKVRYTMDEQINTEVGEVEHFIVQ